MSEGQVKAFPKVFREQGVRLALSWGRRPLRSPRSSSSRWIRCGDGSNWQSSISVHEDAGTSLAGSAANSRTGAGLRLLCSNCDKQAKEKRDDDNSLPDRGGLS